MIDPALEGRVALVTGANCGIGEAIAGALAAHGCAVGLTYLRLPLEHTADPGLPESYGEQRARSGEDVAAALRAAGHRATAIEADLAEDDAPVRVFDHAERELGPVEILVHNASSWLADTFAAARSDDFGRDLEGVSSASHDRQFAVDARAGCGAHRGLRGAPTGRATHAGVAFSRSPAPAGTASRARSPTEPPRPHSRAT